MEDKKRERMSIKRAIWIFIQSIAIFAPLIIALSTDSVVAVSLATIYLAFLGIMSTTERGKRFARLVDAANDRIFGIK